MIEFDIEHGCTLVYSQDTRRHRACACGRRNGHGWPAPNNTNTIQNTIQIRIIQNTGPPLVYFPFLYTTVIRACACHRPPCHGGSSTTHSTPTPTIPHPHHSHVRHIYTIHICGPEASRFVTRSHSHARSSAPRAIGAASHSTQHDTDHRPHRGTSISIPWTVVYLTERTDFKKVSPVVWSPILRPVRSLHPHLAPTVYGCPKLTPRARTAPPIPGGGRGRDNRSARSTPAGRPSR
jgi:hypothetical protein